ETSLAPYARQDHWVEAAVCLGLVDLPSNRKRALRTNGRGIMVQSVIHTSTPPRHRRTAFRSLDPCSDGTATPHGQSGVTAVATRRKSALAMLMPRPEPPRSHNEDLPWKRPPARAPAPRPDRQSG